jgi:hypothetical protein
VPSVLLLLVAAFLLMPDRPARPIVVALVHTFAMLFHELAVLFTVPALIALSGQGGGIAQYLVTAFAATSAAYFLCFHFATGQWGLAEYWHWITWHTPDSSFSFNVARNAWLSLRGTARLFVGGKFGQFHSGFLELAILLALVGVGALFVLKAEPATERPRPTAFLVSWIAVYVVFLFFWLPQNTFYRLFYLPPVILLLRGRPRVLYAALGITCSTFIRIPLCRRIRWWLPAKPCVQSGSPEPGCTWAPSMRTIGRCSALTPK